MNQKVLNLRNNPIIGQCIDLVPINEDFLPEIVRLRNQEKSKYYLNQQMDLSLEMQRLWYENYLKRDNDIYWCAVTKDCRVVGTYRLYDITEDMCEGGSFIIDESCTMGMPFALETYILSLETAFEVLDLVTVINTDRKDNKNMNSMSKKLGFVFEKEVEINGVVFNRYILKRKNSKIEKYKNLLNTFMNG